MKKYILYLAVLVAIACQKEDNARIRDPYAGVVFDPAIEALPINQLQYIGSHNSYRIRTDPAIYSFVNTLGGILPDGLDPTGWDYTHIPLTDQLGLGVRSFELDIYHDPAGNRYFNRLGNPLVGKAAASGINELRQPGMKLLHVPDFDYNTHHYTFKSALKAIKNWSDRNYKHLPIFILVELKTSTVGDVLPIFTKALPFTAGAMDSVDQEIIDVFGANSPQVFRPDDLRGSYASVKEAIQNNGWPSVGEMRGKIIFIVYENDNYTLGHPRLEGRQMFQFTDESSPNAAILKRDDSEADPATTQRLANEGYIMRTRADSSPQTAKNGDYSDRDAAFQNGAQVISTDYYIPDSRAGSNGWSDYRVKFDDISYARVNVINAPDSLKGKHVRE